MRLPEIIFLIATCAAATALCLHGWLVVGHGTLVIAAPAVLTLVLLVLAAVRLLHMFRLIGDGQEEALQHEYWQELRGSFRALLWSLSAAPLLLLFGFPFGLAAFAGLYARNFGSAWPGSLLAAGGTFALVWLGAGELFGLPITLLPGWMM